jgi:GNAT superfamily N-acetyltransferase
MCDEWMPGLTLPLTPEQYTQLPRHAAYRYEYHDGHATLSPRPRHYHALLDLAAVSPAAPPRGVTVRPVRRGDIPALEGVFAASFDGVQPFGGLNDAQRLEAARSCLERTLTGGDGPWIEAASFVAEEDDPVGDAPGFVGGIFVTLLPAGDPCDWDSYGWREPPPADAIAMRLGRPHLTWIFVSPLSAGHGTGTALLAAAAQALRKMGFAELVSTFLRGNDSSTLWHWRAGFRLLAYPGSKRRRQARG